MVLKCPIDWICLFQWGSNTKIRQWLPTFILKSIGYKCVCVLAWNGTIDDVDDVDDACANQVHMDRMATIECPKWASATDDDDGYFTCNVFPPHISFQLPVSITHLHTQTDRQTLFIRFFYISNNYRERVKNDQTMAWIESTRFDPNWML